MAQIGFTMSAALKAASAFAIIAPNHLEISLASTYDFQRRVMEQAGHRSALRALVERITGVDPKIELKVVAEPASENSGLAISAKSVDGSRGASKKKPEAVRDAAPQVKGPAPLRVRNDVDPGQDFFVQGVVQAFGAKVVRITDAPVRLDVQSNDADESVSHDD